MKQDQVFIEGLVIETIIGIFDWEQAQKQRVILDITMDCDAARAALADRIEDTINYKAVIDRLVGFVENSRFKLVETLAERCAEIILGEFPVMRVTLRIAKPDVIDITRAVGVMIERAR